MTSKKDGGSAVEEDSSESHGTDSSCDQDDNSGKSSCHVTVFSNILLDKTCHVTVFSETFLDKTDYKISAAAILTNCISDHTAFIHYINR